MSLIERETIHENYCRNKNSACCFIDVLFLTDEPYKKVEVIFLLPVIILSKT